MVATAACGAFEALEEKLVAVITECNGQKRLSHLEQGAKQLTVKQ